jgi:hypothetical protein
MRARAYFWLSVALSAAFLFPRAASAETIRITSGFLDFNGAYNLVGDRRGFRLFGGIFEGTSPHHGVFCDPGAGCLPGTNAVINHFNHGLDFEGPQAFLDGVFYENVNNLSGPAFADVSFVTDSFLFPPLSNAATFTIPFTMTGNFFVERDTGSTLDTLVGSGLATTVWTPDAPDPTGSQGWFLQSVHYDFFGAAPVPEPTTMILAGVAGAAAAFARRRRAR